MESNRGEYLALKKKLKYIFLGILALILVAGGYIFYELKIKDYDVADEQVDEIITENITVDLPDGTKLVLDSDGNIIEEIVPASIDSSINEFEIEGEDIIVQAKDGIITAVLNKNHEPVEHASIKIGQKVEKMQDGIKIATENNEIEAKPAPSTSDTTANSSTPTDKVTVASIKAKYESSFVALEDLAKSRLGSLIDQAKSEYNAKKASGESISYSYFYQKYYGAATKMEGTIDASFNTLYARLENELEQNEFDKAHAQSFKDQYDSAKSSLRSEILSKLK